MSAALSLVEPSVIGAYQGDESSLLGRLIRDFEDAESQSQDARDWAERCRDYYDGKQLTPDEMRVLRDRRQPPVINNKIAEKVDLLCGMERRARSDPKAYPRTPMEDDRADVATQCLRYVSDDNRFDVIRSSVYKDMLVEGFGGAEVIVEPQPVQQSQMLGTTALTQAPPDYEVKINYLPWDRIFFDPHSQHPGMVDARYMGIVIWMDRDEALSRYPGSDSILSATLDAGSSTTYDDRPSITWGDRQRRRVRVVQMWWREGAGGWCVGTFTRGGFLEPPMPSPYLDRHGRGACSMVLRSGFVDRDNNRYGLVARMLSLQDAINKRESKLLHSVNVNRIIATEGVVDDIDKAAREAAKPDGKILINDVGPNARFEIQKDQAEIEGHFQLLQYSISQMNAQGPNASMSGKDPREQSGRAILAQQAGGMVATEPLADELRQWTHKVMEAAWLRVRQFWTAPKMIRVTDNDRNVRFIGINKPVTLGEELGNMPPDQAAMAARRMGLVPGDPRLNAVLRVENDLDDIDVDVMIEEGPDTPNLQYEQFDALMRLPPQILQQIPPAAIIQMSQLRDKQQIIKLIEEHQQANAGMQANAQAAAQAMSQAQIAEKRATAADRQASAVTKLHGIAMDHAHAQDVPVVPGVGPVQPGDNPLLHAAQAGATQAVQQAYPAQVGGQP